MDKIYNQKAQKSRLLTVSKRKRKPQREVSSCCAPLQSFGYFEAYRPH